MEKAKSSDSDLLLAARRCLKDTIKESRSLVSRIDEIGSGLGGISGSKLSYSTYTRKSALSLLGGRVVRVCGTVAVVLRVCESVSEIERLLIMEGSDDGDVVGYLSLIKQQEEVLSFLSDNCGLAVQWMEDIVKLLDENNLDCDIDDRYLLNVKTSLKILKELKAMAARTLLGGGILSHSLSKLEAEFRQLSQSPEPAVIPKLHAIIEILKAKKKLENCEKIFVNVRSSVTREALQALGLTYLETRISESDPVQNIEDHIAVWAKHMAVAVKRILPAEYELCKSVFDKFGSDVSMGCFTRITAQSGFLALLKFGNGVTMTKKDAVKLLKLLDIFAVLDKLRLDFNKLFGGKACSEIQNLTRDIIKQVVDGACEIFFELPLQVKVQGSRMTCPPLDGSVPRFMTFVTNYCTALLQDDYKPILSQVLEIHQIWNQHTSHDRILREEFQKIVKAIEINLETWSKITEDKALSNFFLMNNYSYLHGFLHGTAFGNLMGDSWLTGYVQRMEKYTAAYLEESWGKLSAILSEQGLVLFFPDRTTNEELVKGMLGDFNKTFEFLYKRQSKWVLMDNGLREKAHQLIIRAVVPTYKNYLHNYAYLMGKGSSRSKYVKYSAGRVESMIRSLFQPKVTKASVKHDAKSLHVKGSGRGVSRQAHQVKGPKQSHSSAVTITRGIWLPCW